MKVAILTLRLHTNYGGILQAYALMQVLKRLGHEPWLIFNQNFKDRSFFSYVFLCLKNILKKYILGQKKIEIFRELRYRKESKVVGQHISKFIDRYIVPKTKNIVYDTDWKVIQDTYHFDAYIVGSDQVWRPAYTEKIDYYFFSFLSDRSVCKVAYAASFGIDEWTFSEKETNMCSSLLKDFDAVSVRESSAIGLCKFKLGVTPVHLLDPTMLLSTADYQSLLNPRDQMNQSKLLVYLLDVNNFKEQVVSDIEKKTKYHRFYVNNSKSEKKHVDYLERIAPPVEDWLAGFSTAKYVITDSFHACVFSILFHIPFCVVANESRGIARFRSLLMMFGLEERMIYESEEKKYTLPDMYVNWKLVDEKLNDWRDKSLKFIVESLNKKEK